MKALRKVVVGAAVSIAAVLSGPVRAADLPVMSQGQTVYVSVYSSIPVGARARPMNLSTILSIRNIDTRNSLIVTSIDYYDTDGMLLRHHLAAPIVLNALGTKYIYIKSRESKGGPGANFIVKWKSSRQMNEPIIEALMLGTREGQGISFVSPGKVIND